MVRPEQRKFKKPPTVTLIIWRAFLLHLLCVYSCSKMLRALPDDIKQADFTLLYCLMIRLKLKCVKSVNSLWEETPHGGQVKSIVDSASQSSHSLPSGENITWAWNCFCKCHWVISWQSPLSEFTHLDRTRENTRNQLKATYWKMSRCVCLQRRQRRLMMCARLGGSFRFTGGRYQPWPVFTVFWGARRH